ncbi:MAG TPA: hypothetical protein VEQ18_05020 [Candidatus Nitrosocosmicus sp.]|nr:hypothetical protein [Candidatus Nitrosocosmicus sp.]
MIVACGISHMIHTLAGKTTKVIIFESDENIALWLRRWKRVAEDGIKLGDGEEKLWEDGEVDLSETSNDSSDDSLSGDEVASPAPKRMKTTNIQGKMNNVFTNQVARKSLLQDFDGEGNLQQEEEII